MTALCPSGGPSEPKPGTDPVITLGGIGLDALVTALGFPELSPVISVIAGGITLVTNNYCTADPPADPGLTLADVHNALEPPDPQTWATAAGRIKDWVLHQYWYIACQCTNASTPVAPPPNLPTGYGNSPGLPTGTGGTHCWDVTAQPQFANALPGPTVDTWVDLTPQLLPTGARINVNFTPAVGPNYCVAIPAGVNTMTLSINQTTWIAPQTYVAYVFFFDSLGNELSGGIQAAIESGRPPPQSTTVVAIPTGAVYWHCWADATNQPLSTATVRFDFNCTAPGPLPLTTPCCPPDPIQDTKLNLILNLVQNMYTSPAGGAPPTGWADATVHTGVSGTGSFQLGTNVTGIRATFTTIPSDIRITPGTPTFYWSLGFVTPVAIDVPLRSLRTVFASQAMQLPVQTTAIDYTFPAGAIVTLTELVPA